MTNERVADLHPRHDIKHVRVTLTKHDHRKAEDSYEVVLVVQIPAHTITARKQQKGFDEAIRDAFAAMETELDKIREKRASHEVRITAPPHRGVISTLFRDEGYGFITMEDGTEVYFNRNAVQDMAFDDVEDGMDVSLNVEPGKNGRAKIVCDTLGYSLGFGRAEMHSEEGADTVVKYLDGQAFHNATLTVLRTEEDGTAILDPRRGRRRA